MKRSILLINEWNDLNKNKVNNWISEGYGGLVKNVENEFLTEMVGLNENQTESIMNQDKTKENKYFQDVSNNLKVKLLVRNEERLNFYKKYGFDVEISNKINDYLKDYEMIIVEQQQIDDIKWNENLDVYQLIQYYPLNLKEYEQNCLDYNSNCSNKIKDILPIQTHNYREYKADIQNENVKLVMLIHWNNHINRIDKLQHIDDMIKQPYLISGKIIKASGFWRQLLFSHSKLPKFGA